MHKRTRKEIIEGYRKLRLDLLALRANAHDLEFELRHHYLFGCAELFESPIAINNGITNAIREAEYIADTIKSNKP